MTLSERDFSTSTDRRSTTVEYLAPEHVACADGLGHSIDVSAQRGKLLVLTLAVNGATERASIVVSISGSADNSSWENKPVASFSPRSYCGLYSILLNLAKYPDVRYIRVEWKMIRWKKRPEVPRFQFCVFAEESGSRVSVSAA